MACHPTFERSAYMSNLFNKIFSLENLEKAYKDTLKESGKYKVEAIKFQRNETVNLLRLRKSLYEGSYRFSGYETFKVYEPKVRIINAPHYKDKIVQLALNNVLKGIFEQSFINESYACMDKRGTHKAVDQVQKNLRQAYWEWGDKAYICKADVRKFFYSIDRDILKRLIRKKIKEKDVLWVIDEIIDSGDLIDSVGLPLGNTLSQLCANIYLNEFDQYAKRYLGYKYYVRYADDIVIILRNKKEAQKAKQEFINFLNIRLNMEHNVQKTQVFPINQGVNAYGFKIYRTHRLLRNNSKKAIKRKIKKMPYLINEGKLPITTANTMLASWAGHAKHASSRNFIKSILKNRPYIMLENDVLKINEEEIKCYIETTKAKNGN